MTLTLPSLTDRFRVADQLPFPSTVPLTKFTGIHSRRLPTSSTAVSSHSLTNTRAYHRRRRGILWTYPNRYLGRLPWVCVTTSKLYEIDHGQTKTKIAKVAVDQRLQHRWAFSKHTPSSVRLISVVEKAPSQKLRRINFDNLTIYPYVSRYLWLGGRKRRPFHRTPNAWHGPRLFNSDNSLSDTGDRIVGQLHIFLWSISVAFATLYP